MLALGYARREVEESLKLNKYDDVMATYLLVVKKASEVSLSCYFKYLQYFDAIGWCIMCLFVSFTYSVMELKRDQAVACR